MPKARQDRATGPPAAGWIRMVTFKELARMMTDHDRQRGEEERVLHDHRQNNTWESAPKGVLLTAKRPSR